MKNKLADYLLGGFIISLFWVAPVGWLIVAFIMKVALGFRAVSIPVLGWTFVACWAGCMFYRWKDEMKYEAARIRAQRQREPEIRTEQSAPQPVNTAESFQHQQFINAMNSVQAKAKPATTEPMPPRRERRTEKRQTDAQIRRQQNNMWKKIYKAESDFPPLKREYFNDKGEQVDFYRSRQWRSLRAEALHIWGNAPCACCNEPFNGRVKHVDHIKPRSKYPELELKLSNLQVMCEDCNVGKSNHFEIDWRTPAQRKAFGA